MLKKCSSALLITGVKAFGELYGMLATECDVKLRYESFWNERLRVSEDVIICGGKHVDDINKAYYSKTVVILKEGESPYSYIQKGIGRFIFDHENRHELFLALFREEEIYPSDCGNMGSVLSKAPQLIYEAGDYCFNFKDDTYHYKGRGLYLTEQVKVYLADWLLNGKKDNGKRMYLCNLRKKFGKDFLKDVDRFGRYKDNKNENEVKNE